MVNRLNSQIDEGKVETQETTNRVNFLTKEVKSVTRKIMAKVSELAMHQAAALSLYQEKSEKVFKQ